MTKTHRTREAAPRGEPSAEPDHENESDDVGEESIEPIFRLPSSLIYELAAEARVSPASWRKAIAGRNVKGDAALRIYEVAQRRRVKLPSTGAIRKGEEPAPWWSVWSRLDDERSVSVALGERAPISQADFERIAAFANHRHSFATVESSYGDNPPGLSVLREIAVAAMAATRTMPPGAPAPFFDRRCGNAYSCEHVERVGIERVGAAYVCRRCGAPAYVAPEGR